MIMRAWFVPGAMVVASCLALAAASWAQAPKHTTAVYEDWTVRCDMTGSARTCDLAQSTQTQDQVVSLIVIGRASKTEPLRIVFQVPITVWLPDGVSLATDKGAKIVSASFKRCLGGGCFADAEITDDILAKLRGEVEKGKLLFTDAAQKEVALPVSFKGFAAAYDAMVRQTQ
jgi:Invasion protein B, involved in pathogenesis